MREAQRTPRIVQIEIKAEPYADIIDRMIMCLDQLTQQDEAERLADALDAKISAILEHCEGNCPKPGESESVGGPILPIDAYKDALVDLTQQERQELYKLLHDSFGCRMY